MNFSQPVLGAGANAKTDYAAAQANAGLNFIGSARFKRGLKAELGLRAFIEGSASFSKFINAGIEGTAFARAQAGIQLQLPLNLFDEFGLSARAEAIAEAAAGIEASLGISIGDFILLAKNDAALTGLPLEIFIMFMEEVSIGGKFELNVSFTAKAHASLSVSGTVIEKPGDKAGFYYTATAGAGLAKGVGMGLKAGAEFRDFRRFYGRAVNKSVDTTISEILYKLPKESINSFPIPEIDLRAALEAFGAISKMALRIAYESGVKISEYKPGNSKADNARLCEEVIKVFLEESQRFLISKILESGFNSFREILEEKISSIPAGIWNSSSVKKLRKDLAATLLSMPDEPFNPTAENIDYWTKLVQNAVNFLTSINDSDSRLTEALTWIYCSSEILIEAIRSKLNTASAYATVIGAGTVQADTEPFKGNLNNQPPAGIRNAIRNITGGTGNLKYPDLLQFMANDLIINKLLAGNPEVKEFITVFKKDFAKTEKEIFALLLKNAAAFDLNNPGASVADPQQLLLLINLALDEFINNKIKPLVIPFVLNNTNEPALKIYLEEVLFGAVLFIKDSAIKSILNRENEPIDNDVFLEGLASVLLLLLGRTIVVTSDTFLAAAQEAVEENCKHLADTIRESSVNTTGVSPEVRDLIEATDPEFLQLLADSIEIGGKVLGPLPENVRTKLRRLLYEVFEPLPPGTEKDFLTQLGDDFFIPDEKILKQVTNELVKISKERFLEFVKMFIVKAGDYVLNKIEDLIEEVQKLILEWEKNIAKTISEIAAFLINLENVILEINQRIISRWIVVENSFRQLLNNLSSPGLKNRIKKDFIEYLLDPAFQGLEQNIIYRSLPSDIKSDIRNSVEGTLAYSINSPMVEPVFNLISELSDELEDFIPDFKRLNPDDNLPEQIMSLILDKIEENIRRKFSGSNPHISPVIDFQYKVWVMDSLFSGHWETHSLHIPLGRIEIRLNDFISLIRNGILSLNFYHNLLNQTCFELAKALGEEMQLSAKNLLKEEKKKELEKLESLSAGSGNRIKEILILNPLQYEHFNNSIPVKIHLGGIPVSSLGLNDYEIQRVLICINGELIPPKSLIVEDVQPHSKKDSFHNFHFNISEKIFYNSKDSSVKLPQIQLKNSGINPDTSGMFTFNKNKSNNRNIGLKDPYLIKDKNEENINCCDSKTGKEKVSIPLSHKTDKFRIVKSGKFIHNHSLINNQPGSRQPYKRIEELINQSIPGILIQFKIEASAPYLNEGVNVLSVIFIDRGGERHQSNVSFTFSSKPISKSLVPGWLEIINETSKKKEFRNMSLNGIFQYFNDNEKHREMGIEEYHKFLTTLKPKEENNYKQIILKDKKITPFPVLKTETILVISRDAQGKEISSGKPVIISYASPEERKEKLEKLNLDTSSVKKKNLLIKTIQIAYEKPLTVLDKKGKEITKIIRSSTYITREEIHLQKRGGVKTVHLEYSTEEERSNGLKKLIGSGSKFTTVDILKVEKIEYKEVNGKLIHSFINDPVVSGSNNSLPNFTLKERETKELVKVLGAKASNGIWIPEFKSIKNQFIESPLNIPAERDIKNRLSEGLVYLQNQQKIKI